MSAERRRPVIAANWKMNLLKADAAEYCRELRRGLAAPPAVNARVVIFPSFPLIPVVARELVDSEVEVGGQDLHPEEKGRTPETSRPPSSPTPAAPGCSAATASGGRTMARATSGSASRSRRRRATAS
jgi:triosephosphate isomerase